MRVPVNLASQPFRRDRAVMVASAAGAILLVIAAGFPDLSEYYGKRTGGRIPAGKSPDWTRRYAPFPRSRRARTPSCASPKTPKYWNAASF